MGLSKIRTNRVALHFCDVTLTAKKPRNPAYPEHLISLGDHIRKRRLDLGMHQKDVAAIVNATTSTVTNWEKGRTNPRLSYLPKVFDFLGYNYTPNSGSTLGDKIKEYRRRKGLSIRKLARILDIDPTTLARWERSKSEPKGKLKERVNSFLMISTG
jgi:transcriptional regulator with XRE-family HTH domain